MYRIGLGTDIHRFGADRPLFLGGVKIEHTTGLVGHSDADALLHAVTDAVLGACGLGDIGEWFSDTAAENKDRSSAEMLQIVLKEADSRGWGVVNIDCTITTETPKLKKYKKDIQGAVASVLNVETAAVNIKAKTNEKLDAIGAGEALHAQCIILMERQ